MEKNNISMILGTLLILSFLIAGCAQQPGTDTQNNTGGTTNQSSTGRAVFLITDAAADMGSVEKIEVTVDSVEVHSALKGWVTVSSSPKTYDLLKLKAEGSSELLADVELEEGTYQQMRLNISSVMVTDSQTTEAKLPSGEIKIVGDLKVEVGNTSTASFDFIADESLHVTGNGEYVLAPVIQVETRNNAQVQAQSGNKATVSGGTVVTSTKVGMDLSGNVGVGVKVPLDAVIEIDDYGIIKIGQAAQAKGRLVVGITDAAAEMENVTKVLVTVDSVAVHSTETDGWVTVSSTPQTFDLLKLKEDEQIELAVDTEIEAGTYDKFTLQVSKTEITTVEDGQETVQEAKLPSNELKIDAEVEITENSTATAVFDFVVDESLHVTGNGKYIMAPVIKVETRSSAVVEIDETFTSAARKLTISSGLVKSSLEVGMDEHGNSGVGKKISSSALITIDADGSISIAG